MKLETGYAYLLSPIRQKCSMSIKQYPRNITTPTIQVEVDIGYAKELNKDVVRSRLQVAQDYL